MSDSRRRRLADVLVGYSTRVQPGDLVMIETSAIAAPLARDVYRSVLHAGGHPVTRVTLDDVAERLLREGSDEQLDWVNPARVDDIETSDVRIVLEGEWNTKALSRIDPARQARHARAREKLRNRYLQRAADGDLRWVLTVFPTHAAAQDAEMSLAEYEDFVYGAGLLDEDDPVALWESFSRRLARVVEFLSGVSELRVVADGTDLTLGVTGRTWIPAQGRRNFPDGEVFTAPIETSVQGTISFSYPAVFQGREVEGVSLRFEDGEVVEAHAVRGEDFLEQMIGLDDGARRVGEFAFGLNDGVTAFTRNLLFDEKIGGTVHLALGTSYPESGGLNRSGLHWDMICDLRGGSEISADGEVVYRDGRFVNGIWD